MSHIDLSDCLSGVATTGRGRLNGGSDVDVTQARVSGNLARRAGKAEHPMLKNICVVSKRQGAIDVLLDNDQRHAGLVRCLRSPAPAPSDGVVDISVYSRGFETDFPPCYPGTNG